ncbi:centromere protein I [Engraulis encrasicolus]|uniref:centromere protein I n=1 Tax=Engraulis encrasicolus TaxID=184585 RepID=UPI002FD74082
MEQSPERLHPDERTAFPDENDSTGSTSSNRSLRIAEKQKKKSEAEAPVSVALTYFSQVKAGTPVTGNDVLAGHLLQMERSALAQGLDPHAVSIMLEFAMSMRMTSTISTRVLKFLVPSSVVPQEVVLRGFSWLNTQKLSQSAQLLFLRWVLTMFDMIDYKDKLRAIYGILFHFVTDENLSPFICHILYLLTIKENVTAYRVRKLLDIQSKKGRQPHILQLLALYKVFCPELVPQSVSGRIKGGFKSYDSTWRTPLAAVSKRRVKENPSMDLPLGLPQMTNRKKRKFHHLELPALAPPAAVGPVSRRGVCLLQLRTFNELLENLTSIELPAQMGSLLSSRLALHYLDCVQDESAFLRLNYWLGNALQEEFFGRPVEGAQDSMVEASNFLNMLVSTQSFFQEGFSATEAFLCKLLEVWDGSLHQPQILELLSDMTLLPSSQIKQLLFDPLQQLYFTSSVFFKCSVIECLNSMLRKWLTWHSVSAEQEDCLNISLSNRSTMSLSLSGFLDSVLKLVHFVGRLASVGLQLERCHSLLIHHALDFYETVCDMYLKYKLPLFVMPPAGVFYAALLAPDPVAVDRLCHIMLKYRQNLSRVKTQRQAQKQSLNINRSVYLEFNTYLVSMVGLLWNSQAFAANTGLEVDRTLLERTKVADYSSRYNLVHHPAFLHYAMDFHKQCWPERTEMDLNSIQVTRYWDWYVEYLGTRGFGGLRDFIKVNIQPTANRQSTAQPLSQPPQSQSSQSTESSYCSPSQAY